MIGEPIMMPIMAAKCNNLLHHKSILLLQLNRMGGSCVANFC